MSSVSFLCRDVEPSRWLAGVENPEQLTASRFRLVPRSSMTSLSHFPAEMQKWLLTAIKPESENSNSLNTTNMYLLYAVSSFGKAASFSSGPAQTRLMLTLAVTFSYSVIDCRCSTKPTSNRVLSSCLTNWRLVCILLPKNTHIRQLSHPPPLPHSLEYTFSVRVGLWICIQPFPPSPATIKFVSGSFFC